ncbi:hypothetical protein [Rhizobium sp. F40D2]|uniref:hypothetical protein n=1 Tax=Rhizobium sp. F40D2 TaxID=3453141 RepID=UPI003F1F17A8
MRADAWTCAAHKWPVERQKRLRAKYLRLRGRHAEMSPDWWFDTHGIDLSELGETIDE